MGLLLAAATACGSVGVEVGRGQPRAAKGVAPGPGAGIGPAAPVPVAAVRRATADAPSGPSTTGAAPVTTTTGAARPTSLSATVAGLLTFRGNATRSYYGQGPVPRAPVVRWSYPSDGALCGESDDGGGSTTWCGTGWTGQPAVWERDGATLVAFGAYDHQLHVLDAATGQPRFAPFPTGDLIKGSVSVDPDGYPLLYVGSRDNYFRVVAFDRPELTELWKLSAYDVSPTLWNDDWDGSGLVVGDRLYEGGENGQFHVVALHRGYDQAGRVQVAPELIFHTPAWDDELLADFGGSAVSIEGSVALRQGTAYFANSAGLVQGWDVGALDRGDEPSRTFRFWTGDDTDASVVIDEQGFLYVASEYEVGNERSAEVGQLMKLDPSRPEAPVVWSLPFHNSRPGGMWATPALHGDLVVAASNDGQLVGVDRGSGQVRWTKQLAGPTWQSPVVVDDVLIEGDCSGVLHAYDLSYPDVEPPELWSLELGGCIESTPAVWRGSIYVGTRAGRIFAIGGA